MNMVYIERRMRLLFGTYCFFYFMRNCIFVCFCFVVVALSGCRPDESVGPYKIELITVNAVYNETRPEEVAVIGFPIQFKALKISVVDEAVIEDVTNKVEWHTSGSTLRYSHPGVFYGQVSGQAVVSASLDKMVTTDNRRVWVSDAYPVLSEGGAAVRINKGHSFMLPGMREQHSAFVQFDNGYEQDLTDFVQWSSSDDTIASVNSFGEVIAQSAGHMTVHATYQGLDSGLGLPINVLGLAQLQSTELVWSQHEYTIPVRTSSVLTLNLCILDFDEHYQCEDVTSEATLISDSQALVFDESIPGRAKAYHPIAEPVNISGIVSLHDGDLALTLTAAAQVSIINPILESITLQGVGFDIRDGIMLHSGLNAQLKAQAQFLADEDMPFPAVDVTEDVIWQTSDSHIASFHDAAPGLLISQSPGLVGVYVTLGDVSSEHALAQVTSALLTSLILEDMTLIYHETQPLSVMGVFSDGSTQPVSGQVSWTLPTNLARMTPEGTNVEALETEGLGMMTVTAENQDGERLTQSATLEVSEGVIPCGNQVNDTNQSSAAEACLKVIEINSEQAATSDKLTMGMQFVSTPSEAVLSMLHFTQDDDVNNEGRTYSHKVKESGKNGPAGAFFGVFQMDGGSGTRQTIRYCDTLNELEFNHRADWKLADSAKTLKALRQVAAQQGSDNGLWGVYGWPTRNYYWTNDEMHVSLQKKFMAVELGHVVNVNLPEVPIDANGSVAAMSKRTELYVTCESHSE